jgi:hypothetical protein
MGTCLKRGKYNIDLYADGKRVRECVGRISKRKAENALKARQGEIVQGRHQMQRKRVCPTFRDFVTDFMEYSKAHKSSRGAVSSDGHHMDTTGISVVSFNSAKSLKTHNVRP